MPRRSITRTSWIQQRVEAFVRAQRRSPKALRVLAEGDSWFTHPTALWRGKSVIGHLQGYRSINLVSLAAPGDTLARYPDPPNRQWALACNPDWLAGQTYDAVLISGGGNDVLGDHLQDMVKDKSNNSDRSGRELIIKARLRQVLDGIAANVVLIRNTVNHHLGPQTPIFMHGYSYAQSDGRQFELLGGLISFGPWIQDKLHEQNITERDEQQDIVNALIDAFNGLLKDLESKIDNFIHVDFRPLLGPKDWDDEIHPNGPARQRLAAHLRNVLTAYPT